MQMSMAGQGDADTHGQTLRVNMMECARRHVDKVSRFGVDHITSLDLPVDFTFQHDPEFVVVQWFPYDQALEKACYPNEVEVLRKALKLINQAREMP